MPKKNEELLWLEKLQQKAKELHAEEAAAIAAIRAGFVDRAVVFMDVVGSTDFKVQHSAKPEEWILRVQQFSKLLAAAALNCNGQVVKFIGDEVMATFSNVNDAQNLIARVSEIEDNLKRATGFETRIKVAVDFGSVYELTFQGHSAPDPQGTIVDRCARIAKFGAPGEVLASATFAQKTPKLNWQKVGTAELKGLGPQTIYQLEHITVDTDPRIELRKKDHAALTEELDDLRTQNARMKEQNKKLQRQLRAAGQKPSHDAVVRDGANAAWALVQEEIDALKDLIRDAPGSSSIYARFLFLHQANKGPQAYNAFDGRSFDDLIEANLVTEVDEGYYEIDKTHPRNRRVLGQLREIKTALDEYLEKHDPDPDDLFEWSLDDAGFWEKYIGRTVV